MTKWTLLIPIFVFLSISSLRAQQATVAAGGDAEGSGGTISYSVGQVFYSIASSDDVSVTPGVQQTYEVYTLATDDALDVSVSIFPNPTTNYLTVDVGTVKNASYQLYDLQGKLLKSAQLTDTQTSIDASSLPEGIYLVQVLTKKDLVKTFKIIKQ